MADLIQVDKNNNLIIEIPEGQKDILLNMIALANGYSQKIPNNIQKEIIDTKEEIQSMISKFSSYQLIVENIEITNELDPNFGKVKLVYIDEEPIDNPQDKISYGISHIRSVLGDEVKNAAKYIQLKDLRESTANQLAQVEEQIVNNIDNSFENLKIK